MRAALWVLCPVYKDVESFMLLRERLLAQAKGFSSSKVQFVVVDDSAGADPETARLNSFPDVSVLTPPFHLGHQGAIVYGLRTHSKDIRDDDILVTLDSDGEDRPEDLPRLLRPIHGAPNRVALAYRTKRGDSVVFKAFYFFFKVFFRICTGLSYRTGNYAAYAGAALRRNIFHPYFNWSYSSALLALDLDIIHVPCARGSRYFGRSKMKPLQLVHHGLRLLMPFRERIALRALVALTVLFVVLSVKSH